MPQDPNDEPASELLRRIREEREKTGQKPKVKRTRVKTCLPCSSKDVFFLTLVYNSYMQKAPLAKTNPYLKDPAKRERGIALSVASSSAIEGIHVTFTSGKLIERKVQTGALKLQKTSGTGKKRK